MIIIFPLLLFDSSMVSVNKGVVSIFFTKVLVSLTGLITVILTSRWLGAEGRGAVSLFVTTIAFLQMFCDFGCSSVIINLTYRKNNTVLWKSALIWALCIVLLSYPVLLLFSDIPFVWLIPVAAFLLSASNVHNHLLMGARMVSTRNLNLILQPVLLLLFFFIAGKLGNITASSYALAFMLSALLTALFSYLKAKRILIKSEGAFVFEKEILSLGFWVQTGHAVQFLNYRAGFYLIVYFISEGALGIFNNAVVLSEALWILGHSIGQMMHMQILNTNDGNRHRSIAMRWTVINAGGTLLMLLVLLAIPGAFWSFLFSKGFEEISGLLLWLAPGVMAFSVSNILNHYLHAKDRFREIVWCNLTGLVAGFVSALWLIPEYGLEGACMAWSIAFIAALPVYLMFFFRTRKP